MNQLTIRGYSEELEKALRTTAKNRGISLNKAALYLMRQGAGLRSSEDVPNVIGDALDAYFGSLDREEADIIEITTRDLDRVHDEEFWK